ncbi:hypothetical protein J1TS3_33680 [Siminovitchia fordii]|uniref:Uncharacterized protein n=1 Tax=Siminovitchia fordii TaxID=254759 RepID=A0ABQ4K934_9BACI|nr:hypothetical protein J1TS3_33680 [Siminovitchia fordii]
MNDEDGLASVPEIESGSGHKRPVGIFFTFSPNTRVCICSNPPLKTAVQITPENRRAEPGGSVFTEVSLY